MVICYKRKMKTLSKKGNGLRNNNWKTKKGKNKTQKTNRLNKLHIKFDMEDRRDYLTGFQRRKRERREKAFKKMEEDLKSEKKRIKKERKDIIKKMISQGHELLQNEEEEKSQVTVTNCGAATVEICNLDLTSQHHIGINQMDLSSDKTENKRQTAGKNDSDKEKEAEEEEKEEENYSRENLDRLGIHSHKDLYRSLRKSSFQVMKHSSLMKQKQARDAKKQKKVQIRQNNHRKKLKSKKMRHRQSSTKNKA